jgi:hypothetical protein
MDQPVEKPYLSEILPRDSVTITHTLGDEIEIGPVPGRAPDCCFTYIQFEKLYPLDVKTTLTLGDGRSLTRDFTSGKTVRSAFVGPDGQLEDEEGKGHLAIIGGLGRCIDVDIQVTVVSTVTSIKHYHFHLCCDDPKVQEGHGLAALDQSGPNEVVKTPLLGIKQLKRGSCP